MTHNPSGDWEVSLLGPNQTSRPGLGETTSLRGIWVDFVTMVRFHTCESNRPGKAANNPATASACQDGDGVGDGDGKAGTELVVVIGTGLKFITAASRVNTRYSHTRYRNSFVTGTHFRFTNFPLFFPSSPKLWSAPYTIRKQQI